MEIYDEFVSPADEDCIFEDIKNFKGGKPLAYPLWIGADLMIFPHKKKGVIDFWLKDYDGRKIIEGNFGSCVAQCKYNATKEEICAVMKLIVNNA